ncbi:DUF1622 domain-containing protein [Chryseobacterium shandongense]|jgi:uncharacterized membrane protein|uniref:DUF1622 domain-containing protein n=1 Tax=Chryseobacterium shandongense TaxID=1493872 RepID=A0AAD0YAW4_9FLAO|nr:DUF1622 domain-containing protein [Chryseobacterium shandongense]AZA87656.1 DUF1622 domain-containing protein [Chryseobacterium shandongense]AZA96155.1 DUF1622 domain-containing protein [Chryseobacterium shandongense]
MEALNYIAIGISIAGSMIIIWGVLTTVFHFWKTEKERIMKKKLISNSTAIRNQFNAYLILGLDFMLEADIIHTIHNPVLKELYVLAMIVVIRSVISFFLLKEVGNNVQDKTY